MEKPVSNTKFMYIRDPKSPRVVTIARKVVEEVWYPREVDEDGQATPAQVENRYLYAYSVNYCTTNMHRGYFPSSFHPYIGQHGGKEWYGDAFNKKFARQITEARLEKNGKEVSADWAQENFRDACIEDILRYSEDRAVVQVIRNWLDEQPCDQERVIENGEIVLTCDQWARMIADAYERGRELGYHQAKRDFG